MTTIQSAIDGARAVRAQDGPAGTTVVVWKGGTTFNVYSTYEGNWTAVDTFSLSDEEGRPVDQETAEEQLQDILATLEEEREEDL